MCVIQTIDISHGINLSIFHIIPSLSEYQGIISKLFDKALNPLLMVQPAERLLLEKKQTGFDNLAIANLG